LASAYLWLKAGHIIAIIAWMAGMLYLPRLFVYHASVKTKSEVAETFKTMERRLYRVIMLPAMAAAWITGAALVWVLWDSGIRQSGWAWTKFGAIVAMSALHLRLGWHVAQFGADRNRHSSRYYRFANEVPTLLLVLIVVMVVIKPF
jgi:putative membrane protein